MKVKHKQCYHDKSGNTNKAPKFENLTEAIENCTLDSNCMAVYDRNCDNKEEFQVCPKNTMHTTMDSCAYYKLGTYLKFLVNEGITYLG